MREIGFQHGVTAAKERMRRLDPGGFRADGTGAWDKFFRSMLILVQDHDVAYTDSPPPPPPLPPPPPVARLAPQTYNKGSSGQDARYCTAGLPRNDAGEFYEPSNPGIRYDEKGLCKGGRSGFPVEGLKPADAMDGREPCDPYNGMPPWPAGSYNV